MCRLHPASVLVLNQPLVSGNLWAVSPWDCLIAQFHHFLSAWLPLAEAGGISESRLKTARFLQHICILLCLVFRHLCLS